MTLSGATQDQRRHLNSEVPFGRTGGFVDQQLKHLMKELGEAINESLADSEQIADVVARIKDGGYDIFLCSKLPLALAAPVRKPPTRLPS